MRTIRFKTRSGTQADVAGWAGASLPPVPSVPPDTGAPVGSGTFESYGQDAPDGMYAGAWHWARKLFSSLALKTLQLPLPEIQQIPGSIAFEQISYVETTASGVVALPGCTLQLTPGQEARIDRVNIFMGGVGVASLSPTNYATFTIAIDGSPVPGWTNRATFPRYAVSIEESFDAFIRVGAGRQISAYATNTDGGTYIVGLFYTGWQYSVAEAKRWRAGQGATSV